VAKSDKQARMEMIRRQTKKYARLFPRYAEYAQVLRDVLEQLVAHHAPFAIVAARPKTIASFAEKIWRKQCKYRDAVNEITDLCGARVITHTSAERRTISEAIEALFDIDPRNSLDVSRRLKATEFGYRSVHYVARFKRGVFPTKDIDVEIPVALFRLENPWAEIQVRTMLEHAWAVFNHEMSYKSGFANPAKWQRELAGVAAMLELADSGFARIQDGLRTYAASYGAYMSDEEIRDTIEMLEGVLESAPEDAAVTHRIGKMAIALGDWRKAIKVLSRGVDTKDLNSVPEPILKDLGIALCKLHAGKLKSPKYRQGQKYLEAAAARPIADPDAIASLAGTWKGIDDGKARELYHRAFEADPSDSYSLGNYLEYEIAYQRSASMVPPLTPLIETAIARCRDQAEVGVNLPWAYYDMGKFLMLLGRPYDSLAAYSRAIHLSTASFMIETSLRSVDRLVGVPDVPSQLAWAQRLLLIGLAAKFPTDVAIRRVAEAAVRGYEPLSGAVMVIAGGCDADIAAKTDDRRALLGEAFRGWGGTVIAAGTAVGVGGLVSDLRQQYPKDVHTIGYVPKTIPADVTTEKCPERCSKLRYTEGDGFSALEPLQYWTDIIASGISPSDVKVVAIDGGAVGAAECQIALALGARVAVLEGSGGEVGALLSDAAWSAGRGLISLPADGMTVRAFVGPPTLELSAGIRIEIGRAYHEDYRRARLSTPQSQDPSMGDWASLPEDLRSSNLEAADHIFEKLRQIGCTVHKVRGAKMRQIRFTRREIEMMAEMEHGRWTAERLLQGWKCGEKRDPDRRISRDLVSWAQLADDVKEQDRRMVRKIPELLAKEGLEIRRDTQ